MQCRKASERAGHLGGADGHAKWFDSEADLFGSGSWGGYGKGDPMVQGLGICMNPTTPRH